jgi:hypothetical protein
MWAIVLALGAARSKSLDNLQGKVPELYMIGDCAHQRKLFEAIHDASRVSP